jgi:hypothetical protein
VAGQALVHEGVLAVDEVEDAAVLAHDAVEEELGLPPHGEPQAVVEVRIALAVGRRRLEPAELEPLSGEAFHEGLGLLVREHAAHLRAHDLRLAQSVALGAAQELLVGHARPEEVR